MSKSRYQPVRVTWHDAHSETHTWTPADELTNEPCVVHTVGWLLCNQKENHVVVAQSFIDAESDGDLDGVLCIPIGMVKAVVVLSPMSENTVGRASQG